MSLVSLTFNSGNSIIGKGNPQFGVASTPRPQQQSSPSESMDCEITRKPVVLTPAMASARAPGKLILKKVDQFFGLTEVVLLGHVETGVIQTGMSCQVNGNEFRVTEVESKIGKTAKKGLAATVVIDGPGGKEVFEGVTEVTFN